MIENKMHPILCSSAVNRLTAITGHRLVGREQSEGKMDDFGCQAIINKSALVIRDH